MTPSDQAEFFESLEDIKRDTGNWIVYNGPVRPTEGQTSVDVKQLYQYVNRLSEILMKLVLDTPEPEWRDAPLNHPDGPGHLR